MCKQGFSKTIKAYIINMCIIKSEYLGSINQTIKFISWQVGSGKIIPNPQKRRRQKIRIQINDSG